MKDDRQKRVYFAYNASSAVITAMVVLYSASIDQFDWNAVIAAVLLGLSVWYGYGIRPGIELWLQGTSSTREFVWESALGLAFVFGMTGLMSLPVLATVLL